MRKLVIVVAMAMIFGVSGIAEAQQTPKAGECDPLLQDDCYKPGLQSCEQIQPCLCGNRICDWGFGENYKTCPEDCKKKKKRKKKKKPCQVCPQGEKGDKGDPGEQGDKGDPGECPECECENQRSPLRLGIGVMANGIWPSSEYSWAVGPALQLQFDFKERHELTLTGAYMPLIDGGGALEFGYTYYLKKNDEGHYWLGLGLNVYGAKSGLELAETDGTYIGAAPAIVFRPDLGWGLLRFEVGPYIGAAIYDFKDAEAVASYGTDPTDFNIGVHGSAFLAWYW